MSATYPQVFMVDSSGDPHTSSRPPDLVPCWTIPSSQGRVRSQRKGRYCTGATVLALLAILLLVFAALGLGAYEIYKIQTELAEMRQNKPVLKEYEEPTLLKQVGITPSREEMDARPAAHVIARIEKDVSQKTLRWDPQTGRAFTEGGVVYRDGGLQVNQTGLYHVYTKVEFFIKHCSPKDQLVHTVFVRRSGHPKDLILMEGHREGFCSSNQASSFQAIGSSLGSVLQLQKEDRVYVNVSRPAVLSHNHHANFFGLYKI